MSFRFLSSSKLVNLSTSYAVTKGAKGNSLPEMSRRKQARPQHYATSDDNDDNNDDIVLKHELESDIGKLHS